MLSFIMATILLAQATSGTSSAGSSGTTSNGSTCSTLGNKTICYNEYSSMTCTRVNNVTTCEVIRR